MIVENLTGHFFPPAISAAYARKCGARVSGGTDMLLLSQKIATSHKLTLKTTNDLIELINALEGSFLAIVNVGGDRTGYKGLFSNKGHFVLAATYKNGKIGVLDPGYYDEKYDKTGRKGKITMDGNLAFCSPENLDKDAESRNPRYYIFKKVKK